MNIGLIVGSLREGSWNKKVALTVKELFPEDIKAELIDIKDIPLYNQDLDGQNKEYDRIRREVKEYDGFIFFTPEYNRSIAPALKNVLDIVSVDPNGSGWRGKTAAVFSASIGGMGAMASNLAIRQVFVYLDLIPMQQPEVYLSKINELFDDEGNMIEDTRNFLKDAVNAFVEHNKKIL